MPNLHALCRAVSPAIADCELSFIGREPIDAAKAQRQHANYVALLRQLGAEVIALPSEPDLPDSVFVEDTVLMFDDLAVLTRPGALSRRPEVAAIQQTVRQVREIVHEIQAPGTLDGGDVLRIGKQVYVGRSARSNQSAIDQLADFLRPFGYQVHAVLTRGCLHLKSAVTALSDDTVLINPDWVDSDVFSAYRQISVAKNEPHAANVVLIASITSITSITSTASTSSATAVTGVSRDENILMPANFPETQALVEAAGFAVHTVDVSELQKAEGAVTCCSVLFES